MSKEAEQSLLGSLLIDNSRLDAISLEPDYFGVLAHKVIFKSIKELEKQQLSFDAITISEQLGDNLELAGGVGYLVELANNTPSSRNISSYAKIIERDYFNAELTKTGMSIQMIGEQGGDFEKNLESSLAFFDSLKVKGEKDLISITQHIQDYMKHLEYLQNVEGLDGLSTGFKLIDDRLQGLKDGELYIIGGRPASGKSAYALNIANHIAKENPVLFFSMEMPSKQLIQRAVASIGGVEMNWLKGGLRSDDSGWPMASSGMQALNESGLIIDDNGTQTLQSVKIKCKKQKNLRLVVIDYLQLMTGIGNTRTEEIGSLSRGLKKLAKELECPVIVLSQLNRGVESRPDKRPRMSDLRESGDIEADADVIQFIYRDEYYYDCDSNKGYAEILTAKFRDGEVGRDILATELSKSRFKDVTHFTYQPYEAKSNTGGFNG